MEEVHKKILIFCLIFIPIRFAFMYSSNFYSLKYGNVYTLISLIYSFYELYLYFNESSGIRYDYVGNYIITNELRPVHALLFILFSFYLYKHRKHAYIPLLLDIIISIVAFSLYNNLEANIL